MWKIKADIFEGDYFFVWLKKDDGLIRIVRFKHYENVERNHNSFDIIWFFSFKRFR